MKSLVERIHEYNTGRLPAMLALKHAALHESSFRFFRGTANIFYEDLVRLQPPLLDIPTPVTWISGDLHVENFGSYKGNNRLVYFDINDFDEAVLAPCTLELTRLAVSIHLAGRALALPVGATSAFVQDCITAYAQALSYGKPKYIERETADGMVREMLTAVAEGKRRAFLDKRTERHKIKTSRFKQRRFIMDGRRYIAVTPAEQEMVAAFIRTFAESDFADRHASPEVAKKQRDFFRAMDFTVLDVAHRIAGTGSLGVRRYGVIIEGNGSPHKNYLLDLKEALPPAALPLVRALGIAQPHWDYEAERCAEVERRMQASSPALLHHASIEGITGVSGAGTSFVIRELQPTQNKIALAERWHGKASRVQSFLVAGARLAAWSQLRSAGRQGSAIADDLITFGKSVEMWRKPLADYARGYADHVEADWRLFCTAAAEQRKNSSKNSVKKPNSQSRKKR